VRRILLLLVAACTPTGERGSGQCPLGETCSPTTPTGLAFLPPVFFDNMTPWFEPAIAVGGTTNVILEYEETWTSPAAPIDLPYTADDGGGPAVRVAGTVGAEVMLTGTAPGSNELRIVDPDDGTLYDRRMYTASPVASIEIEPDNSELTATSQIAYASGTTHFGIRLRDASGQRMYDTSLQLAGGAHWHWDVAEITEPAGSYTLGVTSGGTTQTFPITVADHADSIVAIAPPASVPAGGYAVAVCFGAQLGTASVVGFAWSFLVDGKAQAGQITTPDCVDVGTLKGAGATISVQATAGGATTTLSLPVGP
jgi:hypothetical protein